jgi:hypothetical protein
MNRAAEPRLSRRSGAWLRNLLRLSKPEIVIPLTTGRAL